MTDKEFKNIIELVKADPIHKTYSIESGFVALTSLDYGRKVIYKQDSVDSANFILYKLIGKTVRQLYIY